MSDIILANQDIVKVDKKIHTDIFNYNSSEFFINMKESDIPPKGHSDRADFIKREREKCRIGLTVGGVYIPGNLYFHFNHFYLIGDDGEDESGRTQNAAKIATLRDNDWIIHTEYAKAVKEKKGYCLASSRQIGKDLLNSSILYQKDKEITIGEIKVGDEIYGDDGKLTKVVGVYPQGKKPVYKIKFEEGSVVYAGGEHLWKLWDRHSKQYIIKTTLQWLECPARYSVDLCSPIEYFKGATIKEREILLEQFFIKKGIIKNNIKIITFNDRNVRDIFVDIARSLGNHASSIDKKTHKTYYELHINLDKVRKKVISIEYVFDEETTCIEVDNDSHLFLTNDFTITHNTTCLTALTLREVSLYENAEALLIFGSLQDKQSFTKKIKVGIEHGQPFIIRTPIDKDWSNKTEIRFGYTNKDNTTVEKARIFLYNVDGGNDTEKGAGKTVSFFAMDEALKHGSKIYYEDKEDVIENVKVGDKIFGKDGKLTTVLEVHPQGITDIYKITLKDGRTVETSPNHLWYVYDVGTKKYKTITTEQMFKTNNLKQIDKRYNKIVKKQRYFLPKNDSIDYPERNVLIEPYYLGLFLGDGSKSNVGNICNIDEPIIEYLRGYAKRLGGELISNVKNHQIRFKGLQKRKDRSYILRKLFNHYNLHGNKHIPNDYLYNSKEIRLEVLKGLMDSDGTVYKDGHIEFSNTDYPLIKQVEQLVRSLGINCKLGEAKKAGYKNKEGEFIRCKDSYKLSIRTTVPIFKLERKLNNYNFSNNLKKKSMEELTSILSIEKVENDYSTCIKVDNQDSLFLTNDFIVTHNCGKYPFQASWEAVEPALKGKNGYRSAPYFSWTGGDTEKAKEAFKFTLNPQSSNLLEFETEGKKTSKVMFATYRQDCKIKVPFTTFLDKENIKYDKNNKDLKSLQIEVSDVEEATKKTLKELEDKKKDKDPLASIKHRAYYPLCLKDILAKETKNNFNKEFIDQQLEYLKDVGYDKVEVFRDIKTGEVKHKFSFAPVIEDWRKPNFLDTPVKIWDFPKHTEFGVHVIGLDGYREDETLSSDSLGYFTVLRRLHSDLEDPFRGKQVASWLGRKKNVKEMLQLLLDVAEWYNAQILYEHVDRSVLDFFEGKRKLHLLIDTVPLQKEISIKTKTKNNKGLRPTVGNKQFLLNSTLGWVNEELEDESLGYSRIMDEVLLNQLAEYDPDENLDCYIGFSHAVAAYNYFEKFGVPQVEDSNKKQITSNKKPVIYNAFGIPYNKNKKNAFGF